MSFFSGLVVGLLSTPVQTVSNLFGAASTPAAPAPAKVAPQIVFVQQPQQTQPTQPTRPNQPVYIVSYQPTQLGSAQPSSMQPNASATIDAYGTFDIASDLSAPQERMNGAQLVYQQLYRSMTPPSGAVPDVSAYAPLSPATSAIEQADTGGQLRMTVGKSAGSGAPLANPINFLSPGWDAIASGLRGTWAGGSTLYPDAAALAQAQANYHGIVAQINALEQVQAAGLCDESCGKAMASLQTQLSVTKERVDTLTQAVADDQMRASSKSSSSTQLPAPSMQIADIVSGVIRAITGNTGAAPTTADATVPAATYSGTASGGSGIPASVPGLAPSSSEIPSMIAQYAADTAESAGAPANVAISGGEMAEAPAQPSLLSSDNVIVKTVVRMWSFIKSIFTPQQSATTTGTTTEQAAPKLRTCSLFLSLFGGCK